MGFVLVFLFYRIRRHPPLLSLPIWCFLCPGWSSGLVAACLTSLLHPGVSNATPQGRPPGPFGIGVPVFSLPLYPPALHFLQNASHHPADCTPRSHLLEHKLQESRSLVLFPAIHGAPSRALNKCVHTYSFVLQKTTPLDNRSSGALFNAQKKNQKGAGEFHTSVG